jgi:acetylglutamate kinase
MKAGIIPVIAPLGVDERGQTFNCNADTAAGAVAAALKAHRLLLLTDVKGVLNKQGELMPEVSVDQVRDLMADGTVYGGMIPKLETAISAVKEGVDASIVLDGRVPHALLLELFTSGGAGTLIRV